jgi:hypothetical protein
MPFSGALALLLLSLVAGGCTQGEPASVAGQVVYAGKPVADGALRMFPLADTPGVGAEAAIRDGQYTVALEEGLLAGRYRIEVRATESTGPIERPSEEIDGTPPPKELRYEIIPERYNDGSTLEVELQPGENRHDLDLQRDAQWEAQRQDEFPEWIRGAVGKGT